MSCIAGYYTADASLTLFYKYVIWFQFPVERNFMKISTLLEREPFVKIFEKTLASFLTARTGSLHTVEWLDSDVVNKSLHKYQNWYCNPLINSVFVKGVDRTVFDSINGEYAITR